jgi:hypothetical protein
MPVFIALSMYPVSEVCEKLAELKGRHKYKRQHVDDLIKKKLPMAQKVGNRYLLTEAEINWLAAQIRIKKRHNFIDK